MKLMHGCLATGGFHDNDSGGSFGDGIDPSAGPPGRMNDAPALPLDLPKRALCRQPTVARQASGGFNLPGDDQRDSLKVTPQAFSLCFLDFASCGLVVNEELMAIPAMSHFPLAVEFAGIAAEHELASNSSQDVEQLAMLSFGHFECIFPGR